jgi:hypothetical protein
MFGWMWEGSNDFVGRSAPVAKISDHDGIEQSQPAIGFVAV